MKKILSLLSVVAATFVLLSVPFTGMAKSITPTVAAVSSEDPPEWAMGLAVDGDDTTFWHSLFRVDSDRLAADFPHYITFDLNGEFDVTGFDYTPRQDMKNGWFADYEIYASLDGTTWDAPVLKASFEDTTDMQYVSLPKAVKARFLKLVGLSAVNGTQYGAVAEFVVYVK